LVLLNSAEKRHMCDADCLTKFGRPCDERRTTTDDRTVHLKIRLPEVFRCRRSDAPIVHVIRVLFPPFQAMPAPRVFPTADFVLPIIGGFEVFGPHIHFAPIAIPMFVAHPPTTDFARGQHGGEDFPIVRTCALLWRGFNHRSGNGGRKVQCLQGACDTHLTPIRPEKVHIRVRDGFEVSLTHGLTALTACGDGRRPTNPTSMLVLFFLP